MTGVALKIDGGAGLKPGSNIVAACAVNDCVHVHMAGDMGDQIVAAATEEVYYSSGQITRGEDFGEGNGGQRELVRGDDDDRVATEDDGREQGNESDQRRLVRRENGDDAGRLGGGEIEV